jgi:predicted flap endonuclease-1-like 5' DNA nuclease
MKIEEIEGIGPVFAEKLRTAGIESVEELLEKGASRGGRTAIVEATGIDGGKVLEWVNHADLMRIKGVGSQYSDLLEAAGVDSPAELARRNAANLADAFQSVVAERPGIVRRIPTEAEIADWIADAKGLPKVVEH